MNATDIVESLNAGVLVVRHDGVVTYANNGAGRILERQATSMMGAKLEEFLAPLAPFAVVRHGVALPGEQRQELRVVLPSGRAADLGFTVRRHVGAQPSEPYAVILFQEITSILKLQRERDRLLQLATLGSTLPTVLHELKNPLAAMAALLEVLLEGDDTPSPEDLRALQGEVRRMTLALQGIGAVVRSARAARLADIGRSVRETCRVLEPLAKRKHVRLVAEEGTPGMLPLEPDVLSGVLFNLVKNSIEACTADDVITVRVYVDDGAKEFVLEVRDTGPGMSPEVRARACDPFFTSKERGSGLGLTLCHRVAELSRGQLRIESEPGSGTRIALCIPRESGSTRRRRRRPHAALRT